jgi:Pyridoxamine 5'-phosphate oxidase
MTDLVPSADRPRIPAEYGVPTSTKGLLAWAHAEERLRAAMVYWIATSSADGTPHVRPVDGLWHAGVLYVGGSPETRWARDLQANPRVAVHLDDGIDVVILEGEAELLEHGVGPELAVALADLSNAKYPHYGMTPESYAGPGPFAIRPTVGFGWTKFPKDVTRFRFDR